MTRFSLMAVACLALLSTSAQAENVLLITKTGYYLMVIDDATGVPDKPVAFTKVLDTTNGTTPVPPGGGPDTPEPPVADPVSDLAQAWAEEANDPAGAAVMQLVYGMVGTSVEKGDIPPEKAWDALKAATDQGLSASGTPSKWKPFRVKVADYIAARNREGRLNTGAEIGKFLKDLSTGVGRVVEAEAAALDEDQRKVIIQIIMLVLQLFGGIFTGTDSGDGTVPNV